MITFLERFGSLFSSSSRLRFFSCKISSNVLTFQVSFSSPISSKSPPTAKHTSYTVIRSNLIHHLTETPAQCYQCVVYYESLTLLLLSSNIKIAFEIDALFWVCIISVTTHLLNLSLARAYKLILKLLLLLLIISLFLTCDVFGAFSQHRKTFHLLLLLLRQTGWRRHTTTFRRSRVKQKHYEP